MAKVYKRNTPSAVLLGCLLSAAACATDVLAQEQPVVMSKDQHAEALQAEMQEMLAEFPEATQVDKHTLSWEGGKVLMVLPGPDEGAETRMSATWHGCPSGWYCVYQHANWGGARLQFSDCTRNDLSTYGFRDKTSSWVNNGPLRVQVKNDLSFRPDPVLWTMNPNSASSYVGDSQNDKADYFQCA